MSRKKIGLHEVAYERLSEAEKRRPHPPIPMKSGNSKGPIKMWVCHEVHCQQIEYSYVAPHRPPICTGGARWSFTTTGTYDPRIHAEKVLWDL